MIRYELNGEDDIDHTIDLDNYAVAQTTPFDVDSFKTVNDLLIKILLTEGKEIIREAPFNEEEVVDNSWGLYSWINFLLDGPENILVPALKNMQRRNRHAAMRSIKTPIYSPLFQIFLLICRMN